MVTSALAPTRNGLSGSGVLVILILTGKRWVTLTQLPVAFSGGSTEKVAPEPALIDFHHAVELGAGIHVEADGGGLARPDAGEVGFLEIRVDPPGSVLDQGEGRCAGLHDGTGPEIAVGDPAAAGGGDVSPHPLMRRLVELGGGGAELRGGRGHRQLGVLCLGELGLGVFVGLQGVVP